MLHCAGEDVELELGVLTEKLGTSLMSDTERLKLGSVRDFLHKLLPLFCFSAELMPTL